MTDRQGIGVWPCSNWLAVECLVASTSIEDIRAREDEPVADAAFDRMEYAMKQNAIEHRALAHNAAVDLLAVDAVATMESHRRLSGNAGCCGSECDRQMGRSQRRRWAGIRPATTAPSRLVKELAAEAIPRGGTRRVTKLTNQAYSPGGKQFNRKQV